MLSLYRLPNQSPDEKVVKVIRRDLMVLFQKILIFLFLTIVPLAFYVLILNIAPALLMNEIAYPIIVLITSAYYMFAWLFFMFLFVDYYLDTWIITTDRIIDIDQRGFFNRTIAEQRLTRIQDVASEVKGVIPTIFKYGNLRVQTAAEQQFFLFEQIPNPDEIRDLLIKLAHDCKAKHPNEN